MSQSIGKAKPKIEVQPPKSIRAASFVSRILDRSGRSSEFRKFGVEDLDGNWRQSLILEINRNDGFIPVSKAKKAHFFEVVGRKQKTPASDDPQLPPTRSKRELEEYLHFIGAGPQ